MANYRTPRARRALILTALVVPLMTLPAGAQYVVGKQKNPEPSPRQSGQTGQAQAVRPVQGYDSEVLYEGSLALDPGETSNLMRYRRSPRQDNRRVDALVTVEGFVQGRGASLRVIPVPSGYPGYNYTRVIPNQTYRPGNQTSPFTLEFYLPGLSEGLSLRHEGGSRLIVKNVVVRSGQGVPAPPTYQPPGYYPPSEYPHEPDYGYRPPYLPERPREPVVAPRPAPYQPPIEPRPNYVVLYEGDLRIRQDEVSRSFAIPDWRVVRAIEIEWTDKDEKAQGFLLLNQESRPSLPGIDVDSPGRGSWRINRRLDNFRILARGDHIWVRRIVVIFAEEEHYVPRPQPGLEQPRPPRTDSLQVFDGPVFVRRNNFSQPFYLQRGRTIDRVVVYWTDFREDAIGHIAFDNEPWSARQGADVESPGSATFQVYATDAYRLRIYARNDDIRIENIKVYYR